MSRGLSFGPAADLYDAIRPTYPPAALHWALGEAPKAVLDLGAGTGILTRVLLRLGYDVRPVEPDEAMRAKLAATTPGVQPLAGRAEAIPVPDGQVDAVGAGQAYHWFDQEAAHREIARVLAAGGVCAPIWNVRDHDEPWVLPHRHAGKHDQCRGAVTGPSRHPPGDIHPSVCDGGLPGYPLRSKMRRSPINVSIGSWWVTVSQSSSTIGARPPVATTAATGVPSSLVIRRTSPSTWPAKP